jgi:hypothetical protein
MNNISPLRSNQHGGFFRGTAKRRAIAITDQTPEKSRSHLVVFRLWCSRIGLQKLDLNSGGSERPPKQISFRGSELRSLGAGTVGATDFPRSNTVLERPPPRENFRGSRLRPLGHGKRSRSLTMPSATDSVYLFSTK